MSATPARNLFRPSMWALFVVFIAVMSFSLGWLGGQRHMLHQQAQEDKFNFDPFRGESDPLRSDSGRATNHQSGQPSRQVIGPANPTDALDPFRNRRPDQSLIR